MGALRSRPAVIGKQRAETPRLLYAPGLLLSVKLRKSELKVCGRESNSAQDHFVPYQPQRNSSNPTRGRHPIAWPGCIACRRSPSRIAFASVQSGVHLIADTPQHDHNIRQSHLAAAHMLPLVIQGVRLGDEPIIPAKQRAKAGALTDQRLQEVADRHRNVPARRTRVERLGWRFGGAINAQHQLGTCSTERQAERRATRTESCRSRQPVALSRDRLQGYG